MWMHSPVHTHTVVTDAFLTAGTVAFCQTHHDYTHPHSHRKGGSVQPDE